MASYAVNEAGVAKARAPRSWEYAIGRGFTDILNITTFAAGRGSRFLRFSYAGSTADMADAAARLQRWDALQR